MHPILSSAGNAHFPALISSNLLGIFWCKFNP
nr:MAG TPA: hypothetical protein [Caudoviricetes sp.]